MLGDPDDALAQAKVWESIGVDQLTFGVGLAPIDELVRTIELLGKYVIPKIDTPTPNTAPRSCAARCSPASSYLPSIGLSQTPPPDESENEGHDSPSECPTRRPGEFDRQAFRRRDRPRRRVGLVARGEVFGLIGPNGAGKTTLFDVLSGVQHASSGRVVFEGNDSARGTAPRATAAHACSRSHSASGISGSVVLVVALVVVADGGAKLVDPVARLDRRLAFVGATATRPHPTEGLGRRRPPGRSRWTDDTRMPKAPAGRPRRPEGQEIRLRRRA